MPSSPKERWIQRSNGFLVDYSNGRLDTPVKSATAKGDGVELGETDEGDAGLELNETNPQCKKCTCRLDIPQ